MTRHYKTKKAADGRLRTAESFSFTLYFYYTISEVVFIRLTERIVNIYVLGNQGFGGKRARRKKIGGLTENRDQGPGVGDQGRK